MVTAEELLKKASGIAKRNYNRNIKLRKPVGLINGQKNCAVAAHKLGIRKMSANGCGAIAVYNALVCAGHEPDFNVISLGIDCYALNTLGIFGTSPKKVERFFEKCRIPAVKANDYDDFVRVMGAVRVGVLCYWVKKPRMSLLHFVAIVNMGDHYDVCNRYMDRKTPSPVPSIEKLCPKECYVCGFFMN